MGLSYKTIILLALFATTVDKFIFTPESFKTPPKSICMRFMGSSSVLSVEFIPFRFIFEHSIGFLGLSLHEFWSQMSWVGPRSRSAEKVQVDRVDFRELVLDEPFLIILDVLESWGFELFFREISNFADVDLTKIHVDLSGWGWNCTKIMDLSVLCVIAC